jgi:hypothetical protein
MTMEIDSKIKTHKTEPGKKVSMPKPLSTQSSTVKPNKIAEIRFKVPKLGRSMMLTPQEYLHSITGFCESGGL